MVSLFRYTETANYEGHKLSGIYNELWGGCYCTGFM